MTKLPTAIAPLKWDVFVASSIPVDTGDLAPGMKRQIWSPMSATLIYGERDAVLVDALMTLNQAHELADWIAASGKNLKLIYATHGHGDHFFGAGTILERFPGARFVARPDVVQVMRTQVSPQPRERWD